MTGQLIADATSRRTRVRDLLPAAAVVSLGVVEILSWPVLPPLPAVMISVALGAVAVTAARKAPLATALAVAVPWLVVGLIDARWLGVAFGLTTFASLA